MPQDNVVKLNVVPTDPAAGCEPQENVIERLESLLERAKSGEIQSVVAAYVNASGRIGYSQSFGERETDHFMIHAALNFAVHELCADMSIVGKDAEDDPPDEAG